MNPRFSAVALSLLVLLGLNACGDTWGWGIPDAWSDDYAPEVFQDVMLVTEKDALFNPPRILLEGGTFIDEVLVIDRSGHFPLAVREGDHVWTMFLMDEEHDDDDCLVVHFETLDGHDFDLYSHHCELHDDARERLFAQDEGDEPIDSDAYVEADEGDDA